MFAGLGVKPSRGYGPAMRHRWGGIATLVGLMCAPLAHAAPGDNQVGINTHVPSTAVVDLAVELGVHWIRVDNDWVGQTNPCSGSIGFIAPLDTAVSYAIANGIDVYMTLAYTPACASTGNGDGMSTRNDVPDPALYGSYVRQSVAHYRAMGVTHFGLWNEANLGGFWEGNAAQYVSNVVTPGIANIATGCADAGSSDCLALGPDLAHVGDFDVFLEDTLNAMTGAGLAFDILTHHIYQDFWTQIWDGDQFVNALDMRRFSFTRRSLLDVLTDTGYAPNGVPTIEMWLTETGHHCMPATDAAEMARQADFYMNVIDEQLIRSWYTNSFFYEILDSGDQLDGFGITRSNGDGTYFRKPAFTALMNRIATEPELQGGGSTQCADGEDNDGDLLVDLDDPGCADADDDDESDDPPPDEPERLVALPAGTIAIDGSLDDWTDEAWIAITSPDDFVSSDTPPGDADDLSARFAARWDTGSLYLAIEVTDNAHDNSNAPADIWQSDSLQAAFDTARNGGSGYDDTDDYELGWALVDTAPTAYRWHAPVGAAASATDYAIVRSATTTRYELRRPAAELGQSGLADGQRLGFTLLVNDDDGAGRTGWIEWTPGIGQFKAPDDFGEIALLTEAPLGSDAGPGERDAGIAPDATGPGGDGGGGGCCDAGDRGTPWATMLVALVTIGALRRRS